MTSLTKKNKNMVSIRLVSTNKCKIILVENYKDEEVDAARYHR